MSSLEYDFAVTVYITMVTVVELLSLLLVSVLWGCTNPLLKRGTEGIENVTRTSRVSQLLAEVKFLFLNLKYLVPFLLNQSGSLVYYYTLSTTELSLAVPVANSLTFICTLLTGKLLGEEFGGKQAVAGMFLTMAGITLCVISSIDDKDTEKQNMTQAGH
ncbi:transmembrane protein 234 [Chaetodon auriga]|uniref:transmembrane protein 234 n=1 Tax=Chaetodon auriga TaxID=39042 RepID=UPI0040328E7C